jgi:heat shock protein HslJ
MRVVTLPLQGHETTGPVTRYSAADTQHRLSAEATREVCRDTMSGMPHPYSVTVQLDEQRFKGCGGAPLSLLTGHEWVVEDLDGGGIIDRSRISLAFSEDEQRAWGMASCNRFYADFVLTGEGLGFSQPAGTMKACAPALMVQEQKFFRILGGIIAFDIDPTGALVLSGTEGSMKAYPATPPAE